MKVEKQEIRDKYDEAARWYDRATAVPEWFGVGRLRREVVVLASGRVLEIACGTGGNFRYYRRDAAVVAADMSEAMLSVARRRAGRLGLHACFAIMDGERLAVGDRSFDTVLSTLTLCTFPDPVAALREMSRVCREGGRVLLLEHGRSDREWIGRWQDRSAGRHAETLGCRWNRRPLDLVRQAGLTLVEARRTFLGVFHLIDARP